MQHKVITIGVPSIKRLPKAEERALYSVLLTQAIEFKRRKAREEVCPTKEQKCTSTEVTTLPYQIRREGD